MKIYDGKYLIAFVSTSGNVIYNRYAFELPRLHKKIKRFIKKHGKNT